MWVTLATAAATAFNLNCSVRTASGYFDGDLLKSVLSDSKVAPETRVFRIDLARSRWCEADCRATRPIVSANDAEIVLYQSVSESGSKFTTKLDREVGAIIDLALDPNLRSVAHPFGYAIMLTAGKCDVAPFSGMPEPKF